MTDTKIENVKIINYGDKKTPGGGGEQETDKKTSREGVASCFCRGVNCDHDLAYWSL